MVQRVGFFTTLESDPNPTIGTSDWISLATGSSNNYAEYGNTGGTHKGQGVWMFLDTAATSVNTKCVLRDATTGAYIDVSPVVVVNGSGNGITGAWYYYPMTGTYTTTNVGFFVYAENGTNLKQARVVTNNSTDILKHTFNGSGILNLTILSSLLIFK